MGGFGGMGIMGMPGMGGMSGGDPSMGMYAGGDYDGAGGMAGGPGVSPWTAPMAQQPMRGGGGMRGGMRGGRGRGGGSPQDFNPPVRSSFFVVRARRADLFGNGADGTGGDARCWDWRSFARCERWCGTDEIEGRRIGIPRAFLPLRFSLLQFADVLLQPYAR